MEGVYAQDAGITSDGDKIRLVGWLKARMSSSQSGGASDKVGNTAKPD